MTDKEINEAVINKLGWKWYAREDIEGYYKEDELYLKGLPDYCHSIVAAFDLVTKIEWFCLARDRETGKWSVWDMPGTEEAELICEADTVPMAICKAFLKLP